MILPKIFLISLLVLTTNVLGSAISAEQAHEAVIAAVEDCRKKGYDVTAVVVNNEGLIIAMLRDNKASPLTLDSARMKAYTATALGQINKLEKTSQMAERILANPAISQLVKVPNILLVGGGLVVKNDQDIVGAIAVGGAPGGHLDEECAAIGLEKIIASMTNKSGS